jgi:hypothetical protein
MHSAAASILVYEVSLRPVFRGFSLKRIFHERHPSFDTRDIG